MKTTRHIKCHSLGRGLSVVAAVAIGTLALAGAAQAAGAPKVTTGNAKDVSYGSATLAGTIDPNGSSTSYYFQYGPTKAYGGQTAIAGAGAGDKTLTVEQALMGLQPLTRYHYRLLAVNGDGTTIGGDHTFQTTKVPLSLAILAAPNPVLFGAPVIIQGTLTGTENTDRQVVLQANPFPFTAGFQNVGNTELTNATGGFTFTILGAALTSQFRVVTTTNPAIVSPVATEDVAVRVSSHVARTRRPGWARVYGTVTPAEDGAKVAMLRIAHGRGELAGGTILVHHDATSSSFSRVVRVHKGLYRVLVQVANAGQVSNYGQSLLIR
jgi:hypothetical protein